MNVPGHLLSAIDGRHDLRDGINQDVLVVDGRHPFEAGDDLYVAPVVLISSDLHVRLLGEGEKGMLKVIDQVLQGRVCDVTDEKITLPVALGEKRAAALFHVFAGHDSSVRVFGG